MRYFSHIYLCSQFVCHSVAWRRRTEGLLQWWLMFGAGMDVQRDEVKENCNGTTMFVFTWFQLGWGHSHASGGTRSA